MMHQLNPTMKCFMCQYKYMHRLLSTQNTIVNNEFLERDLQQLRKPGNLITHIHM